MAAVFTGQLSKSKGKHKSKSPIKCSVSSTKIIPSWLKSRRSCYVENERFMYSVLFAFTEWLTYISDKSIDRNVTCYINLEKHLHTSIYSYLSSKKRYSYLQSHVLKVIIHWYGLYYGYIEVLTAKYQRKVGTKKKIYNLTTKQQTVGFKRELDTINYIVIFRIVSVEIF